MLQFTIKRFLLPEKMTKKFRFFWLEEDPVLHKRAFSGKIRKADKEMDQSREAENMEFDIIIPTYKPDERLELLLERLARQTCQPRHILLVNTEERFWRPLPPKLETARVKVLHIGKREFDHGGTRRRMAERSETEFFVCMTQDALPADRQLLEHLLAAFEDATVGAAYARQLAGEEAGVIERYTRQFNYPEESRVKRKQDEAELGIKTWFCSDVCAAYRKSAYVEAGGFVPHTIFNEDMLMAEKLIRLGYGVAYQAEAKVWHSHRYTCKQQFQRNFDLGVSHRQYREVFGRVSSESEGIKMVKKTALYLLQNKKAYLLPELVIQSAAKLLGYQAGKRYDKLPHGLVKKCSASPGYFE